MASLFESTVHARAALAGNPSDGFGGRVVATVVPAMAATVRVQPNATFKIGDLEFVDLDELRAADLSNGSPARLAGGLFIAALRILLREHDIEPCKIEWDTSIPQSVGLAGSSALTIACLRAAAEAKPPRRCDRTIATPCPSRRDR